MGRAQKTKSGATIVKKYANRRLYDTGRSGYVTLDDLAEMVQEGHDFVVQDAKSGEDLTQSVLTQIIVEQEAKGPNMLPESFLKDIIKFYGNNMQAFLPAYLEQSMKNFVASQEQFRESMEKSFGGMIPQNQITDFEEMNRKNMELVAQTMKMFTPFSNMFDQTDADDKNKK